MSSVSPPYPMCPACNRRMAFVRAELQPTLANAMCRHFACECGETDEDIVAERALLRATSVLVQAA